MSCEKKLAFENNGTQINEQCKEAKINWEFEFYTKKPAVLSTFLDLNRMKKKALKLHKELNFSIVHCRTVLTTEIGLELQLKGAKLIFDIRGFWPDERVDGKLWNINNPLYYLIYRLFKKKEKRAYLKADRIVTLTQNAKSFLSDKFDIPSSKFGVVPCTVDLNHFKLTTELESSSNRLKKELKLEDNYPIVCYSGSLGTRYLIHEMLHFFQKMKNTFKEAKFLIVTHSDTTELKESAEKLGIKEALVITSTTYQ